MGNSRYSEAQEQGQQPWQCGDGHWVTGSRCEPQGKRRAGQGHGLKNPAAHMTASSPQEVPLQNPWDFLVMVHTGFLEAGSERVD